MTTPSAPWGDQTSPFVRRPVAVSRTDALEQQIASYLSKGDWRLESRTDHAAVMVKGKPVNHVLHLILSLVTVGIWLPVWLIVAIAGGEKRKHLAA